MSNGHYSFRSPEQKQKRRREEAAIPEWEHELLKRCQKGTEIQQAIDERFSSADDPRRRPPANELATFVLRHFSEDAARLGPFPDSNTVKVAERGIRYALEKYSAVLSPYERAWLLSAHGLLQKRVAYGGTGSLVDLELGGLASKTLREAAAVFEKSEQHNRFHRHLSYLAADLLLEIQKTRKEYNLQEPALLLRAALTGHPRGATKGLFFQIGSRLFWMNSASQNGFLRTFLDAVAEDLFQAWAWVPACVLKPKSQRLKKPAGEKGFSIGERLAIESDTEMDAIRQAKEDSLGDTLRMLYPDDYLTWEANDRFAICVLLYYLKSPSSSAERFLYEAQQLWKMCPGIGQERGESKKELLGYFAGLPDLAVRPTIAMPVFHIAERIHQQMVAGNRTTAINDGLRALAGCTDSEEFGHIVFHLSNSIGTHATLSSDNSYGAVGLQQKTPRDAERQLLEEAIIKTRSDSASNVCGWLEFRLANHFWNTLSATQSFEHLEQARIWAGRRADISLALRTRCLEWKVRDDLQDEPSDDEVNGFILGIERVWGNSEEAFEFIVGKERPKFPTISHGDDLRLLESQLLNFSFPHATTEELRKVFRLAARTNLFADPFRMAQVWRLLLQGLGKDLPETNVFKKSFRLTSTTASQLVKVLTQDLPHFRANRLTVDLAPAVVRWAADATRTDSKLAEKMRLAVESAIEMRVQEIYRIRTRRHLVRSRINLEELLSAYANITSETGGQIDKLVSWLSLLKSITDRQGVRRDSAFGEEISPEDESETDMKEDLCVASLEGVKRVVSQRNAAVIDFFLGEETGSFALVVTGQSEKRVRIRSSVRRLDAAIQQIQNLAKSLSVNNSLSFPASMERLATVKRQEFGQPQMAQLEEYFRQIGEELFPSEITSAVRECQTVYVIPHRQLFGLPLHLLPISSGAALIDCHDFVAVPSSEFLLTEQVARGGFETTTWLCADVEDIAIGANAKSIVSLFPHCSNTWHNRKSPDQILAEVAAAKQAVFYVHGTRNAVIPTLTRLSLRNGIRLTVSEVRSAQQSFKETGIFLFACHSADSNLKKPGRESLGLTTEFLAKGAPFVLACLWPPEAEDASLFARRLFSHSSASRASSVRFAIRSSSQEANCDWLGRLLRFGCFLPCGR